jgi:hypothetical protein
MDEILKRLNQSGHTGAGVFDLPELLLALSITFVLCMMLAYTYKVTHRGLSYSVSYVHAMIIMGVTTAVIMLIIGSNIARAFSLVGALSVIRFRNAMKETRDVGFLFMSMAIGMAAGTGFYLVAVTFTVFASVMMYFLFRFRIGAITTRESMLTVHLPEGRDHKTAFSESFYKFVESDTLLSMESIRGGMLTELVYSVRLKKGADPAAFLASMRAANQDNKVTLLLGIDNADV